MRYRLKVSAVEAVRFNGGNVDEIEAAAALAEAKFVRPDGNSPNRRYAIWDRGRNTWAYVGPGDWVVVSDSRASVWSDEAFRANYVEADS